MIGRPARHFSMIRQFHLADVLTLMNGFAGMGSLFSFMQFLVTGATVSFWIGTALLPAALLFDVLDGRVARWRRKSSAMGQELDSLADVVSFGVAPAAMGFAVGLRGGWDLVVLSLFVGCGISRLARYNVTAASLSDESGKVRAFEGLPIPSSLLLVALFVTLAWTGRWLDRLPWGDVTLGPWNLHPIGLLYLLHGFGMISKTLRVPKP